MGNTAFSQLEGSQSTDDRSTGAADDLSMGTAGILRRSRHASTGRGTPRMHASTPSQEFMPRMHASMYFVILCVSIYRTVRILTLMEYDMDGWRQ